MPRKGISFPPKDAALRDDVHALGNLVGELLKDQCGAELFDEVESDRQAAIGRREGDADDCVAMVVRTRDRPPGEALELIRAFTTWFQVVNMAEKVHRVRRRRQYVNDSATPQPGGLEDCFTRLKAHGLSLEQVLALLAQISIEPVFTAHPTESTRRTLLRQQQRVARLLMAQLDPSQTPAERAAIIDRVRTELTTGWQTAGNSRERLTVADEREHVLFFLVEVIYKVVPAFYEGIEAVLVRVFGDAAATALVPELLRFGSWVGGDMDGHPDVHAKTIRESCARHHQLIINRYFLDAQALAEKLSQSGSRVGVSAAISERIEQYKSLVPGARSATPATHDRMPYRVFLGQIAERLRAAYDGRSGQYERAAQLIDDLQLIERSLREHRGANAGLFHVRRMLRRVRTFGLHLITLDVRQNVEAHRQIVGRALGDPAWSTRGRDERVARLRSAIERDEAPSDVLDAACKRALWVFEATEYCRHRYGEAAIGSYVVSMASGIDDLLEVLLLARWAGLTDEETGQVPLDVAPLFESVEALEQAGDIIGRLLADPGYRAHLAARGNRQTLMIGYADSNKSIGVMGSRWLLRKAQEAMVAACDAAGVQPLLFHGRGGAVGRGGGRTGGLVRSMPPGAFRGRLRVTEQGESINDRYGLRPIAYRTFEQGLHGVALATAGYYGPEQADPRWREAAALMAKTSQACYRALVHEQAAFIEYFQCVTPVDVIERAQIGSRPVSRPSGQGVEALRAIPWSLSWSQSRHMLPGWYGAGTGLAALVERYGSAIGPGMYGRWPFFEFLVDDIEMSLARADMGIAAFYDQLARPEHDHFATSIRREFDVSRERILAIKGCVELLDSEPTLQRSIRLRNPYVDPIHLTQVDLLRRWREAGRPDRGDRELFDALVASVNGISQGLQGAD
jgi:phosphoenolpyruvate carboxylase